ncbi:MAG: hypothetical protein H7X95_02720 [Deltaproteobacteria bacterium]|nr:hypothetical protein [Deltaproteobacteria bacterium]
MNVAAATNVSISTRINNGTSLNLAGSSGITFWARGVGTLRLFQTTGVGTQHTVGALTGSYQQYTVTWTQLGVSSPTLSGVTGVNLIWLIDGANTELYLDEISFVSP